jgi:hypothetical protein
VSVAQTEAMSALTGAAVGPLGGVVVEGGLAAAPIQVALGVPASPVFSSLVSLVTLTQVISVNHEGEGFEALSALEQPVVETEDGNAAIDRADAPGQPVPLMLTAQPAFTSNDPTRLGQVVPPTVIETATPVSAIAAPVPPSLGPIIANPDERKPEVGTWMTRLVLTGLIAATAFRGRRAVHELRSRRVRLEKPRSAHPLSRHATKGSTTITWLPGGAGHAPPHHTGRAPARRGNPLPGSEVGHES